MVVLEAYVNELGTRVSLCELDESENWTTFSTSIRIEGVFDFFAILSSVLKAYKNDTKKTQVKWNFTY